jgi:hypothetical protein
LSIEDHTILVSEVVFIMLSVSPLAPLFIFTIDAIKSLPPNSEAFET